MLLLLCICAAGCGSSVAAKYDGSYLRSAQELEKALNENPDAHNRKMIEERIRKLRALHNRLVEAEKNR